MIQCKLSSYIVTLDSKSYFYHKLCLLRKEILQSQDPERFRLRLTLFRISLEIALSGWKPPKPEMCLSEYVFRWFDGVGVTLIV